MSEQRPIGMNFTVNYEQNPSENINNFNSSFTQINISRRPSSGAEKYQIPKISVYHLIYNRKIQKVKRI